MQAATRTMVVASYANGARAVLQVIIKDAGKQRRLLGSLKASSCEEGAKTDKATAHEFATVK